MQSIIFGSGLAICDMLIHIGDAIYYIDITSYTFSPILHTVSEISTSLYSIGFHDSTIFYLLRYPLPEDHVPAICTPPPIRSNPLQNGDALWLRRELGGGSTTIGEMIAMSSLWFICRGPQCHSLPPTPRSQP